MTRRLSPAERMAIVDRASRPLGLPHALETTFPCCEHCPCHGMDHAVPCPVDGCEGQVGS